MKRDELIRFLSRHNLAVQATVAADGAPQAAVVGVAISDALEIVFDTVETTRKYTNLRADPRIALVIGSGETTTQIEGVADLPTGRVRPTWVRYSDFTRDPPRIVEFGADELTQNS